MQIKERAKFIKDCPSFKKFSRGMVCFDGKKSLQATTDLLTEVKLYIAKLCSIESNYLIVRSSWQSAELVTMERIAFINVVSRFLVVYSICTMKFAVDMDAQAVFEVKQTIEDTVNYYEQAIESFNSSKGLSNKKPLYLRPVKISKHYMEMLQELYMQKSSDNTVETNDLLFDCYTDLQDSSLKELELLACEKESDAFFPLQNYLVDQINKKFASHTLMKVGIDVRATNVQPVKHAEFESLRAKSADAEIEPLQSTERKTSHEEIKLATAVNKDEMDCIHAKSSGYVKDEPKEDTDLKGYSAKKENGIVQGHRSSTFDNLEKATIIEKPAIEPKEPDILAQISESPETKKEDSSQKNKKIPEQKNSEPIPVPKPTIHQVPKPKKKQGKKHNFSIDQ